MWWLIEWVEIGVGFDQVVHAAVEMGVGHGEVMHGGDGRGHCVAMLTPHFATCI